MLSYDRPTMGQVNQTPSTADHLPLKPAQPNTMTNGISRSKNQQPETEHHHIWLITGPAGCGKSTIAQYIAESLNIPFLEGDEFHPPANVEKMASNIPLTDEDRWDWLTSLRRASLDALSKGSQGVVLTCSALKAKYRDVIRVAPFYYPNHNVLVHFVYLHAPEEVLVARVAARAKSTNHYMGAKMVRSQFEALEEPGPQETDVITVDVSGDIACVEREALAKVQAAVQRELANDST